MTEALVLTTGQLELRVYQGDLTQVHADAIVNAANPAMNPGGGVDGAINLAAGPRLAPLQRSLGPLAVGAAVLTPGFDLPAKFIIHTVGPIYRPEAHARVSQQLQQCYQSCLDLAAAQELTSIAFPAISTGVYGFPIGLSLPLVASVLRTFGRQPSSIRRVDLVCFKTAAAASYQEYFAVDFGETIFR
ncbi:macro domain-containing protein [Lapidilactobacillus achengensis]|uniref:Macro domain-containing protein n=1 Tax=Lapidilactobacillus achengensis TaxID=2486000 RepID=A0ABW1UN42_9LACO|nr:macro domain-containing protein [Lapidilactobacillus achengensis]